MSRISNRILKITAAAAIAAAMLAGQTAGAFAAGDSQLTTMVNGFRLEQKSYYGSKGYSSNHIDYTQADLRMLAIVIYLEARGEPYNCKVATANVILNRVLQGGAFGRTLAEVITRPNQFCYQSSATPDAECLRVAKLVLDHEVWVVPQNTYFFKMSNSTANWGSHKFVVHMGTTDFYTETYPGRYNGTDIPQAMYERSFEWPQYGCKAASRVRKVQAMLKGLGYACVADGHFGAGTKQALIKFQQSAHLTADGVAGPSTLRALIKKYGTSKYLKLK